MGINLQEPCGFQNSKMVPNVPVLVHTTFSYLFTDANLGTTVKGFCRCI